MLYPYVVYVCAYIYIICSRVCPNFELMLLRYALSSQYTKYFLQMVGFSSGMAVRFDQKYRAYTMEVVIVTKKTNRLIMIETKQNGLHEGT